MANVLPVQTQQAILALHAQGRSIRHIARELGVHRNTVRGYLEGAGDASKCTTNATPGFSPNCTTPTPGVSGLPSLCEPHSDWIRERLESGLSAQRIFQDLRSSLGFAGSYQSVKRFVRALKSAEPNRVWRIEVQPGEEAQVDFGVGAPLVEPGGKRRRCWVFRIVLSFSRKAYSEVVARQDTETFVRAIENAFRHFGGVPLSLNLDNLKAAVLRADWFDPDLNPKLADFARHYRFALLPCRPRTPEHKGKVERSIGYVKDNALKGRSFESIAAQNEFLRQWEAGVADLRIHGTTKRQVVQLFADEKPHLQPLPDSLFVCFSEARRRVHPDGCVELAKAYYSVPSAHIGSDVWVRWDLREVRIFDEQHRQIAFHPRLPPGAFSHASGIGGGKGRLQSNLDHHLARASDLGPSCRLWALALVEQRGFEAMRSLMGLCDLLGKHTHRALNSACARAHARGAFRLRDLRHLLASPSEPQPQFSFMEHHPLLRDLNEYGLFIKTHWTP